jgi:lipopolysaccharide export system permease protein
LSTLDRYVLREIGVPIVVGLSLFFMVVTFVELFTISDATTGLGITGPDMLQALLYSLPPLTGLLLPASALFATLLAIGRMSADREVMGLTALGVSPYRLLRVPALLGVVLGALSCYALVFGEPWGVRGLRDLMARGAQRALAGGVRADEFQEWIPGVTFLARERVGNDLHGVMLADRRDPDRAVVITAKSGVVVSGAQSRDIVFALRDGSIVVHDAHADAARVIRFETSDYRIDVQSIVGRKAKTLPAVQAKDAITLWEDVHDESFVGDRALEMVVLNRKFALPVATIVFALLAVPLACSRTSAARARGFLYSAGLVAAYYYIGRWAELSARSGNLNAALAAWIPNILGVLGMAVLLVRFRGKAA